MRQKISKVGFVFMLGLLAGCTTSPYGQFIAERRAQLAEANWPLVAPEYIKVDALEGEWIQCDEDEFDSKAPWGSGACLVVTRSEVTLRVQMWAEEMSAADLRFQMQSLLLNGHDRDETPYSIESQNGLVVFTAPRHRFWLVGGVRNDIHYLSLGLFDPPLYFRKDRH